MSLRQPIGSTSRSLSSRASLVLLAAAAVASCTARQDPARARPGPAATSSRAALFSPTRRIAISINHALAVTPDGAVLAWGTNDHGQLGTGDRDSRWFPQPVAGLGSVVSVAAGENHSLALRSDGTVHAWGSNEDGQLGTGNIATHGRPVRVPGIADVVSVRALGRRSFALRRDGTVWSWPDRDGKALPARLPGLTDIRLIDTDDSVGGSGGRGLALRADGTVWSLDMDAPPVRVPGLGDIVDLSVGFSYSLAVGRDGRVWIWGRVFPRCPGNAGLGAGPRWSSARPIAVPGLPAIRSVEAAVDGPLFVARDGSVRAWRSVTCLTEQSAGKVAPEKPPFELVAVPGIEDAVEIAASRFGLAVRRDGTVSILGWPQLGDPRDGDGRPGYGAILWKGEADLDGDGSVESISLVARSPRIFEANDGSDGGECERCVAELRVGRKRADIRVLTRQTPGGNPISVEIVDIDPHTPRKELVVREAGPSPYDERAAVFRVAIYTGKQLRVHELPSEFDGGTLEPTEDGRFVIEYAWCGEIARLHYRLVGTDIQLSHRTTTITGRSCSG
jgi:alpha-tubulin suppressor-like RCC1 family protein